MDCRILEGGKVALFVVLLVAFPAAEEDALPFVAEVAKDALVTVSSVLLFLRW